MNAPLDDIAKLLDGSLSKDRSEAIAAWRNEAPENERHFQELSYIWKLSNQSSVLEKNKLDIDTEVALKNVRRKIDNTPVVQLKPRRHILAIACGFIALLCVGFVLKPYLLDSTKTVHIASEEQSKQVDLPDGSVVWLEPHSELTYTSSFTDYRTVTSSGEVYFDVYHNPEKPFRIQTSKLNIEVLGTSFVVMDKPEDAEAFVTVISGKVKVNNKLNNQSIILTKDMSGTYSDVTQELIIQNIPRNINHLHNLTQYVSFYNNNLLDVTTELENIANTKITLQNKDLNNCLFTGQFKTNNVEDILTSIQPIYNFNIVKMDDEYILSHGYCKK